MPLITHETNAVVQTARGPVEYRERGDGPPVLMAHGVPGDSTQGMALARILALGGYRVIAPSRPGYSDTPVAVGRTPEEQADLLSTSFGELSDQQDELGLDGIVWYTWHDSTENEVGACGWCDSAGLVDADRDSKPAWIAFTDLTGGTP